jgi:hypothetical protein
MFYLIFCAVILPLSGFAVAQEKTGECPGGKPSYRAALRHIENGGIGYKEGYTTLEMFFFSDPSQSEVTSFLDARGHVFNNGKFAANLGGGLRTLWENRVYGLNTYYDYRDADRLSSHQIGVGLETFGELFDFRINGYLPIGKKISKAYDTSFGAFSGNFMLVSQKYQSAMKGINAECGFHFGKSKSFDFYGSAGPYYFVGEVARATWGGKATIACTYKDLLTLELSDSYDRSFHNKFQAQISLSFSFGGPRSKVNEQGLTCSMANMLNDRMVQSVKRQEIIVNDKTRKKNVAIDPATGRPYFFVFVDNTSRSDGTYEKPYHSLAQAEENSSPNDIIYVFPGNGTTAGMDSGIFLKANQKFWGSGISHSVQTSQGTILIPAQSNSSPAITNTNFDTEGNAITLATNNAISGFTITSAINDAIYGTDPQSLEVSFCTIENTSTYAIEASFPGNASISLTNNQFVNNVNGVFLNLNGTSTLVCSSNTFKGQTSVSSVPLEILASSNVLTSRIENNIFNNNTTGSIRFDLNNVVDAHINVFNNTITNNGTGSQASLGSSFAILPNGTTDNCSIELRNNLFSGNTSNSLYLHTSGAFTNLELTATANTMSEIGGSGLVLATQIDTLTLLATDNIIQGCGDNGIAVISSTGSSVGNITIKNNTITDIGNASNGIAINQTFFTTLNLSILNNEINRCEGTGIVSYAPSDIGFLTLDVSGNTINNCQNLSSNAAAGLDIEQYANLEGSVTNNTLTGNSGVAVVITSNLTNPATCLTLTGNESSTGYLLINPIDGIFNLSPCDVDSVNGGAVIISGVITPVQSCPDGIPCPP